MTTTSSTSDVPDTGSAARAFKPGPGFYILIGLIVLTVVLALSAAITSALGAAGTSRVLGGIALVLVGVEGDILIALGSHGLMTALISLVPGAVFLVLLGNAGGSGRGFSARGRGTRYKGIR